MNRTRGCLDTRVNNSRVVFERHSRWYGFDSLSPVRGSSRVTRGVNLQENVNIGTRVECPVPDRDRAQTSFVNQTQPRGNGPVLKCNLLVGHSIGVSPHASHPRHLPEQDRDHSRTGTRYSVSFRLCSDQRSSPRTQRWVESTLVDPPLNGSDSESKRKPTRPVFMRGSVQSDF